jgi:hypothetical protein
MANCESYLLGCIQISTVLMRFREKKRQTLLAALTMF